MWFERLQLVDVSYRIKSRLILSQHSFNLNKGDSVWLRSGTGSGKSTLMKIICGLIDPTEGQVLINGENIKKFSDARMQEYRLRLGYLFETGGLLQTLSVEENLLLPLLYHKICSAKDAEERVHHWLEKFKLSHVAKQKPFVLSGSQRKATCALRAIIHEPELVLLDEPLAGLNDHHMTVLFDWIHQQQSRDKLFSLIVSSERALQPFLKSNQEWAA